MNSVGEIDVSKELRQLYNTTVESTTNLSGPYFVSWDVTNRCNFMCKHCLNRSGDFIYHDKFKDELNEEEAIKLCDMIIEINPFSMCLCGGEPLLREDIYAIIKKLSKKIQTVNMVTNGYLLDETKAKKLMDAGLNFLQVSLDADVENYQDSFRQMKGAYANALKAIKLMSKEKIRLASAFCPTRLNIDMFENYIDIMVDSRCLYIRMMPLLPLGRGYDNYNFLKPSSDQYLKLVYLVHEKMKEYKADHLNIEWGDPLEHMYRPIYEGHNEVISMEIRSNGDIAPSIYLPISVGNVRKHTLKEYWNNGFNHIWENDMVRELTKQILFVDDFKKVKLKAWTNERIKVDIMA